MYIQDNGFAKLPGAESSVKMAGGQGGGRRLRPSVPAPISPHSTMLRRWKGLGQHILRHWLTVLPRISDLDDGINLVERVALLLVGGKILIHAMFCGNLEDVNK